MKERPILFNTNIVKAILDGRKTQTRRPVKKEIAEYIEHMAGSNEEGTEFDFLQLEYGQCQLDDGKAEDAQWLILCSEYPEEGCIPIGQQLGAVGDHLWVRETFALGLCTESTKAYRATHKPSDLEEGWFEPIQWKPSIHMPRWVCRLVLEITNVRLERVQDITEQDAWAEGCEGYDDDVTGGQSGYGEFMELWDSVYGKDEALSVNANPWVWVIDFKIVELNGKKQEQAA
tara:strand:+ start:25470 stop:26162 length:693 start_codon:yes stop_codon:yes gene_type:complete